MSLTKSLLKYPVIVSVRAFALMSGSLSLFREFYGLSKGAIPARSLFWFCLWIAFFISAFLAWWQEHLAFQAEREKAAEKAPKLFLEYSERIAHDHFLDASGLFLRNAGRRAFKIDLASKQQEGIGLIFEEIPIESIDTEGKFPVSLRAGVTHNDGRFGPIGGVKGNQLTRFFDDLRTKNLDQRVVVTASCTDYEKREYTTRFLIQRDEWGGRIWCELL